MTATTEIESAKSHLRHYNSKKAEHLDKIKGMGRRHNEKAKEVQVSKTSNLDIYTRVKFDMSSKCWVLPSGINLLFFLLGNGSPSSASPRRADCDEQKTSEYRQRN